MTKRENLDLHPGTRSERRPQHKSKEVNYRVQGRRSLTTDAVNFNDYSSDRVLGGTVFLCSVRNGVFGSDTA